MPRVKTPPPKKRTRQRGSRNLAAIKKWGVRPLTPTQKAALKIEPKSITALAKGLKNLELVRSKLIEREIKSLRKKPTKENVNETARRIRAIERKANALIYRRRAQLEGRAFRDLNFPDLLNRPVFRQLIIQRINQRNAAGSMVLLDIDHFKKFNDTFGHRIGDLVISAYAKALREESNKRNGFAGRYGGEELLVWLPLKNPKDVTGLLQTIHPKAREIAHQLIAELPVDSTEKRRVVQQLMPAFPSFSAGVASIEKGHDYEKQLKTADDRLYISKEKGRKRVTFQQGNKTTTRPL